MNYIGFSYLGNKQFRKEDIHLLYECIDDYSVINYKIEKIYIMRFMKKEYVTSINELKELVNNCKNIKKIYVALSKDGTCIELTNKWLLTKYWYMKKHSERNFQDAKKDDYLLYKNKNNSTPLFKRSIFENWHVRHFIFGFHTMLVFSILYTLTNYISNLSIMIITICYVAILMYFRLYAFVYKQ